MTATGSLAPLRYRPFRNLVTGRVLTALGNGVAPIALAFAVLDLTGSVADVGLVVGARSLANVVFMLFGGVLADRLPRHLVLVGSSLLAAGTQGAVAALVLTGTATIPLLMSLGAVNGVVAAFAFPATAALVPQTVPETVRRAANAVNRLASNAAMIIGAALGGVLVAAVGPGWGLAADALTFLLSGLAFARVRVPELRQRGTAGPGVLTDLREGWREFAGRTWVWVVVLAFMLINAALAGAHQVLGPAVADATIGRSGWGLVLATETTGMVVGGLIALRLRVRRLLLLGVVCCFAEVPLVVALALTADLAGTLRLPVLVLSALVAGMAIEQFGVAWDTSLQDQIPADRLARVYSYDMLGSILAMPVGQVVAGPVALAVGTRSTLLGAAGIVLLATLGMLASRDVRRMEHRPASAAEPAPAAR